MISLAGSPHAFQQSFNEASEKVRFLAVLSPT